MFGWSILSWFVAGYYTTSTQMRVFSAATQVAQHQLEFLSASLDNALGALRGAPLFLSAEPALGHALRRDLPGADELLGRLGAVERKLDALARALSGD